MNLLASLRCIFPRIRTGLGAMLQLWKSHTKAPSVGLAEERTLSGIITLQAPLERRRSRMLILLILGWAFRLIKTMADVQCCAGHVLVWGHRRAVCDDDTGRSHRVVA